MEPNHIPRIVTSPGTTGPDCCWSVSPVTTVSSFMLFIGMTCCWLDPSEEERSRMRGRGRSVLGWLLALSRPPPSRRFADMV